MKRLMLLLFLTLSVIAVPAFAEDVFLLGFTGYDYESPNPNPGTYLAIGEGYTTLGYVTAFGTHLAPYVNNTTNEYTYRYYDLTVADYFFDGTNLQVAFANPGRGRYFADNRTTGTAAQYGINPPNGTAPSNFIDGTLILGGRIDNLFLEYRFTAEPQGSFIGNLTLDEGTLLGQIPPDQRAGWTLSGLAGRPGPAVPIGYDHQISGEVRIPGSTPATHRTWGSLKALYR